MHRCQNILHRIYAAVAAVIAVSFIGASPTTVPAPRAGGDVVGKKLDTSGLGQWLNVADGAAAKLQARRVTLYRWWTDGCPFCAATLPAIEELRKKYEAQGLVVVAVYHAKPPRAVSDEFVREAAKRIGYHGVVAADGDWAVLRKVWLNTGRRAATSVSFLVDGNGVIRFVHPGVEFFPSDKPDEAQQDADYRAMEEAVRALLGEANASAGGGR